MTPNTLIERLRGLIRIPVNDGAGLLDGKDFFERSFPTSNLAREAADRIEALEAQIAEDTIRLAEDTDAMEEATTRIKTQRARIEALEADLKARDVAARTQEPVAWIASPAGSCTNEKRMAEIWRDHYEQEIQPLYADPAQASPAAARIEALEAALRYYADPNNYSGYGMYELARAALAPEQDK